MRIKFCLDPHLIFFYSGSNFKPFPALPPTPSVGRPQRRRRKRAYSAPCGNSSGFPTVPGQVRCRQAVPTDPSTSANYQAQPNKALSEWVHNNRTRINSAATRGKLPYFLRDNGTYRAFYLHDQKQWEHTYINGKAGGFFVTDKARKAYGMKNKQERYKFAKEQRACRVLADNGYQVEHLEEKHGIPSHDINLNGTPAELKSVSSANHILRHAKKATQQQGAQAVVLEIEERSEFVEKELDKVRRLGIKGYYYYKGENKIHKL